KPRATSHTLQSIALQASIERAPAETERLRRLAHVAVEAHHRLLDEKAFDILEAHVFDARRSVAVDAQTELAETDRRSLRHQDAALDGVIELADVARPGMIEQRLQRGRLEASEVLPVPLCVLPQEMRGERWNVL